MTKKETNTMQVLLATVVMSALLFGMPLTSFAHEGEHHDEQTNTEEGRIQKMKTIVTMLEYIRDILEYRVEHGTFPELEDETGHHDDHEMSEDLAGIHIMADGSVMLGNGEQLHDATVTADDMIILADGTMVTPVMDMRASHNHEEEEHHEDGEVSIHIEIHDGMTHAHYSAADGSYSEFFVDADIENEDEVIAQIALETGLSESELEALIDFDEVIVWD